MKRTTKFVIAGTFAVSLLLPGCTNRTVRNTPYGMYDTRNRTTYDNRVNDGLTYDNRTYDNLTYDNRAYDGLTYNVPNYTVSPTDQDLSRRVTTQPSTTVVPKTTTTPSTMTTTPRTTTTTTPNTTTTTAPRTTTTTTR